MVEANNPGSRGDRSPFIGRADALARLDSLVGAGGALITVTGPPGMGKTTIVRRFAQLRVESGQIEEDAVFFCDLSQAWSVADIVTHVSSALGAHLSSSDGVQSTVEVLGQAIAGRGPTLIILDNFEQLVEFAPDTVSTWMGLAPEASFLVTSRDRLRLRGEACLALAPLPAPEAAALFAATAHQDGGTFALNDDNRDAVHELVQRLDGIPLAIELAASRVNVMSPRRMLDRIDRRFQLLGHGPSDGVARQATLRAAIDWSWNLLEEDERSAMAQCSVFRGGFTLDAAEAVLTLESGADVLDLLESLHRKSMVQTRPAASADGEMVFDIYESIRDYAGEHLEAVEQDVDARARHAGFYIDRGEAQVVEFGSPEGTDLAWLGLNRDNLLAVAHAHKQSAPLLAARAILCVAHAQIRRGPYDALLDLLESIPEDETYPPEVAARLVFARGVTESVLGRSEAAAEHIMAARSLAEAEGLERMAAKANLHLGLNQLRIGQLEEARSHLEVALEMSQAPGLERIRARTQASMGMAHEAVAQFEDAERCYLHAGRIAHKVGDAWEAARSRSKMGTLCSFMQGRQDEARGHLEWALDRSLAIGDKFIAATTSYTLGRLELNLGQLEAAEEHLCHALTEYRDMANRVSEGFVRMALGLLHLDRNATDSARAELAMAHDLLTAIAHPLATAFNEVTLAMAALLEGQLSAAKAHAESALGDVVERKHKVLEGISACVCSMVAFANGDADACERYRAQAQECLEDSGWGEGIAVLAVAEACAAAMGGTARSAPDLQTIRYARARIGWRILDELADPNARANEAPSAPQHAAPPDAAHANALTIEGGGRWFRVPAGEPIDLTRKRTLRPMLLLLAEHRIAHPGEALDVDQIFAGVWPGERALPRARKNRVYVSIATLRKMGLDDILTTRGDGYLFRPDVEVVLAD